MTTILEARDVRVEFGSLIAVAGVSFELAGGQLLGLIGPNGAGKTTLLRVLAGLHSPTRGVAKALGKPVLGEHEVVRQHIGFAPDAPPAYEDITIEQFLRFIGGAYGLERAEIEERIDFWLEQLWLTEKRRTKIKELSRGMRQRVTLARTFLSRPHIILLDEPLNGLDPAGRIQLRSVLGMLREQGCAMVLSSHILADLEHVATHIAIIEQGRILRWTETSAFHDDGSRRRIYQLTLLDGAREAAEFLAGLDGVGEVIANGRALRFKYHAEDEAAAELLRRLVEGRVPVASFAPIRTTLEDAYLQAGIRQVD